MATANRQDEIERLERAFWQSMVDGKPEVATAILAEPALMVSGHGVNKFDHEQYAKMAKDSRFKLTEYDISELDVTFPSDDVAIASYRVRQKTQIEGKSVDMEVYDTSTWVNVDGKWLCAMHTECPVASKA